MRTSFTVAAAIACFAFQANQGCQTTPAVSVTHLHGGKPETDQGDNLKIRRGAQEAYAGIHGGFYVVRSQEDWTALWPSGQVPPLPPTLDTTRQMLLVGMAESKDAIGVKMTRVYDSGPFIHVIVKETGAGANCKERPERVPFDAIVVERVDKPVKFWVEDDAAQSCGDPPLAEVKCRVGESPTWSQAVSAGPGDTVDCEMTAQSRGRFEVIDRSLTMGQQPGGSSAKLSFTQGPTRGKFNVDLFGKYIVKGEAVDDGGRRGAGTATVDVLPPKTKDVIVQLLWTNFDNNDDPETFPRTEARRRGARHREGPETPHLRGRFGTALLRSEDEERLHADEAEGRRQEAAAIRLVRGRHRREGSARLHPGLLRWCAHDGDV